MWHRLFPSVIYSSPLAPAKANQKLRRELEKEAWILSKTDEEGRDWSRRNYPGGYTSYGSMDRLQRFSSTFEDLEKHLNRHVARYVRELEMDIDPRELRLATCWVNIMPQHVLHSMHLHPLSVISGTYYVKTPARGGVLKFEDPRLPQFMASPPRRSKAHQDNQRFFEFQPRAGQVVLFESWMKHEVPQNQGREPRISISFNYDWVGR